MTFMRLTALTLALGLLSACGGGTFRTAYDHPVDPAVSRGWRVVDVEVVVPDTLKVSEEKSLLPNADIVWREDPAEGDRKVQIAAVMEKAAARGAAGLKGKRPVKLQLVVERFHALTFEAETRLQNSGVHNLRYVAQVSDAKTGQILAGPERIESATPAFAGEQMRKLRAQGVTQRSIISDHVAAVISGWLGTGPDPRGTFSRRGN